MPGRAWVEPVTLEGSYVRLEPLSLDHLPGLVSVGLDAELWRWTLAQVQTPADMRTMVEAALAAAAEGREVPFATVARESGRVVGSTRYLSIDAHHRRLEIGYTWIAPAWQRTVVNTEAKLLQLRHAFDSLGALRVEFKTDSLNDKSRAALRGIGAVEEGTMRNHMVTDSGRRRHSVYFSVIEEEWPSVRQHLEARLARFKRSEEATGAH
ncbi:MAG TPA: GNAT family N-acetyltransferase [Candidatus Limnocylindrales bacterium]|nr:GNAT family N-acetyltransferase [Candidatus Limnocylindrales bacterium]